MSGHWVDEMLFRHPSGPLVVLPRQDAGRTLDPDAVVDALDALQRSCAFTVIDVPFWVLEHFRVHRIADLQKLPFTKLLAAQITSAGRFSPVVGGPALPHHPFDPAAPAESADVPVIIGTTLDDAALSMTNFNLDEAGLKAQLQSQLGANADRVYALYRDAYPKVTPYLIQARIATDRGFRRSAFKQAELKTTQGRAPAYLYSWDWPSPAFDGKFGAVHGLDVGAAVHDFRGPINGSGSRDGKALVEKFAAVWAGFAKTGKPESTLTPAWPAYDLEKRPTMVFDVEPRVVNDHRGEFRRLWDEIAASGAPST